MFAPLTRPDLGAASPDARLYCRPVCFVARMHELDDACLHLADTMLWFTAWNISLSDSKGVKAATEPIHEQEDWHAVLPDRVAQEATMTGPATWRKRRRRTTGDTKMRTNRPQTQGIHITPPTTS